VVSSTASTSTTRVLHAFCTVTTLNAATGLEAPVVFLLGMSHLLAGQRLLILRSGDQA
jgi:superfamily I DNA/RNA helicase